MLPSLLTHWRALFISLVALATITPTPSAVQQSYVPNALNIPNSSGTSSNWSGYASTSGSFSSVSGTWTIPAVTGNGHTLADATWVGIGGIKSSDLIQAGIQNIVSGTGQVSTTAFYELLPNTSQALPVTVKAGDLVTASITQLSAGQWQITIKDNATGQQSRINTAYNSSLSSAEWIEEAPNDGYSTMPLDFFNPISFSGGSTIQNNNQENILGSGAQAISMVNNRGQALAVPSPLGADGASFTITRSNAVSSSPVPEFDRDPKSFKRHGFGVGEYTPEPTATPPINVTVTPSAIYRGRRFFINRTFFRQPFRIVH